MFPRIYSFVIGKILEEAKVKKEVTILQLFPKSIPICWLHLLNLYSLIGNEEEKEKQIMQLLNK